MTPNEESWRDLLLEYAETMLPASTSSMDALQQLYNHFVDKREIEDGVVNAIGLAFGAQIVRNSDLEWVWTEDEAYPPEIAVGVPGLKLVCHPISMITKRLAGREAWDLQALQRDTMSRLRTLIDDEVARRGH